ncbi:hypothetical protein BHE74_00024654 [Ensete ventricosum]|nr:hypothetical protein BHE74_00024654 [Ensete ventricosum]
MVKVVDLFFITDGMELLHTKTRQDETCEKLNAALGESLYSCEIVLLAESFQHGFSCLPPEVAEHSLAWNYQIVTFVHRHRLQAEER